jgi:uncharacterized protein
MIQLNNPQRVQPLPVKEVAPIQAQSSPQKGQAKWRALFRSTFVTPFVSSKHPPWFDARGIAAGLAIGFGMPIGSQMVTLGLLRLIIRFNVVFAFAFTWVNNPITLIPMYYGYYCLGSVLLGKSVVMDANSFQHLINPVIHAGYFWEAMHAFLLIGWDTILRWSVAAAVLAATSGIVGYVVGHHVQKKRCMRKARAMGISYEKLLEQLKPHRLKCGRYDG